LVLADHLPAEAAEALLELATGGAPKPVAAIQPGADPFSHPDAQRRFRVMNDVEALEQASGAITGVRTSAGVIRGDAYLVAMGSFSPHLVRTLGLKVPVYPVKGYSLTVPIVIRLTGTNEEIAVKILQDNGFSASNDMDAAVQRAVELATKGGAA
jgi:hypothetical protein